MSRGVATSLFCTNPIAASEIPTELASLTLVLTLLSITGWPAAHQSPLALSSFIAFILWDFAFEAWVCSGCLELRLVMVTRETVPLPLTNEVPQRPVLC